eukprot:c25387_g1_i1 orf=631-1338(+)
MGSVDSSYGHSRKREIEECMEINDLDGDGWVSFSKRTCTGVRTPEELSDDLCLLGTYPEECFLQTESQEDLISEMMKSLENVISTTEESYSSQTFNNDPPRVFHRSSSGRIPWHQQETKYTTENEASETSASSNDSLSKTEPRSSDPSESEIDIKYLLEACDDELRIPPSPDSNGEMMFNLAQDILWSDASYPETVDGLSVPVVTQTEEENWRTSSGHAEWPLEILELLGGQSKY